VFGFFGIQQTSFGGGGWGRNRYIFVERERVRRRKIL